MSFGSVELYLAGWEVEVHCNSIGCVHEELRNAHQVLDCLELQPQEVPVYGIAPYGLGESKDGQMKPTPEQSYFFGLKKRTLLKSL